MPLISIITPTYNKPAYLAQVIRSVLDQTLTSFEYFVVDNSLTGINQQVVSKFHDKRIKFHHFPITDTKRKQIYVPAYIYNLFLSKAKGKFLLYVSDDDLLLPNCLSTMSTFLIKNKNVMVCYHDQVVLYTFNSFTHWEPLVRGSGKILKFPYDNPKSTLDGGQIMFRKQVLNKISKPYLPESWNTADICDKIFMEKMWKMHPFFPVNKTLSLHRVVSMTTHLQRNPFKYYLYIILTLVTPIKILQWLGDFTGKRRNISQIKMNDVRSWYQDDYAK